MTISALSVVDRASTLLNDLTRVRWSAAELVKWLNDGQREVLVYRPDALVVTGTGTLVAGPRQHLDTLGLTAPIKLQEITRNVAALSAKKVIRLVPRRILDAQLPGWTALAGSINIVNYMTDGRDHKGFDVYPPALATAQVEVIHTATPADIAAPVAGVVTGNVNLPDIYANALLDYVLYRAFIKDSEAAGNAARAQFHQQAFQSSLGVELQGTISTQPSAKRNTP